MSNRYIIFLTPKDKLLANVKYKLTKEDAQNYYVGKVKIRKWDLKIEDYKVGEIVV